MPNIAIEFLKVEKDNLLYENKLLQDRMYNNMKINESFKNKLEHNQLKLSEINEALQKINPSH